MNDVATPKKHDPLDRPLDGEARFGLMARDTLAPAFVRLYAAVIEGRYDRAPGLLEVILRTAKTRQQRPHKDTEHAWSARRVADQMEEWFGLHMKGEQPKNRVNTLPQRGEDEFTSAPTHAELRRARPPSEPDEAS